jgi:hypothetical protein
VIIFKTNIHVNSQFMKVSVTILVLFISSIAFSQYDQPNFNDNSKIKKAHYLSKFEVQHYEDSSWFQTRNLMYYYGKNQNLTKQTEDFNNRTSTYIFRDGKKYYRNKWGHKVLTSAQYRVFPYGYEFIISNDEMLGYQMQDQETYFIQTNNDSIVMKIGYYNSSLKCKELYISRNHYDSCRRIIGTYFSFVNENGYQEFVDSTSWEYSDSINIETRYIRGRLDYQKYYYKNNRGLVNEIEKYSVNKKENPALQDTPYVTILKYDGDLKVSENTIWNEDIQSSIEYRYDERGRLIYEKYSNEYYNDKPYCIYVTLIKYDDYGNLFFKEKILNETRLIDRMELEITYRK